MDTEGGVFAAEPSKVVDPKWGMWEDGINASALISDLLSREEGMLRQLLQEIQWTYRQVNVHMAARMDVLVEKAKEAFRKFKVVEERTLDGYKLVFGDGSWIMFRRSGTEPLTRIYCESKDLQQLETLVQQGIQCVESAK
jgi:phosphomannomutase